jgi:hypothetical protein
MADEGHEDPTQHAPPVDQPTEDSPAVRADDTPAVVDSTAVEEPGEPPPAAWAPEPDGGTTPREADRTGAEASSQGGRPELAALGAFAGAFLAAKILKRLGGGDE